MTYNYTRRLMENELRLLCPVSVTWRRLEFQMVTVKRSSAPNYTALSYAWGTQDATEHIVLDGHAFPVRPNLWSCLFNLAGTMPKMKLWVDAICINQEDIEEKSGQVNRMHDTYASAEQVAVWLGLPSICAVDQTLSSDHPELKTLQVEGFEWWDNIEDMARREYWNRYWVVQEMLLGRDIVIWCGNHPIPWDKFQDLLCHQAGLDQYSSGPSNSAYDYYPALRLTTGRHIDQYPEIRESLATLLARHRRSECKDPRDRVFALLGLVDYEETTLLSRFFPDYSLSQREVHVIALAHMTQTTIRASGPDTCNISIHSEEVFGAFRISSMEKRRDLLDDANRIDYIGSESIEEIRIQLFNRRNHRHSLNMY